MNKEEFKMQIEIFSREAIKQIAKNPFPDTTALISITDYGYDFAELRNKPEYLLQLAFDDVSADEFETEADQIKYHMITDDQAKQIAEFYHNIHDKVDTLICQCEHGQSRSAAIASAIMEYRNGNGIDIFVDDKYYPNKTIFKKVFKQLREEFKMNGKQMELNCLRN